MPELTTPRGITVAHPDSIDVRVHEPMDRSRNMRAAPGLMPGEGRAVARALRDTGLNFVEEIELRPPPAGTAYRTSPTEVLQINVPLKPGENALLLVESNGVYTWRQPDPPPRGPVTRGPTEPGMARFTLAGPPVVKGTRAATRNEVVDWVLEKVASAARTYVFKYVGRKITGPLVRAYEKLALSPGAISVTGFDPTQWTVEDSPAVATSKPSPKILLLVHGTFSTTQGSFGALAAHPPGRAFLSGAYQNYDAVYGFDHSTLADEPEANASEILKFIKDLPADATIDIIAYSRGGLVARILLEQLLPKAKLPLKPRNVIFVGCTNAGTHLAEPKNLEAAVDLYTNLVAAGARAVSLIPGGAVPSAYVLAGVKTVGAFVKYLADTAIEERQVPGLAAMRPDSSIVKDLNSSTVDIGLLPKYFAITSDFEPAADSPGFTKGLFLYVADNVSDNIFAKTSNDLVVDTSSMPEFGGRKALLSAREDFGKTHSIYHTIYFAQENVARKFSEWLGLPQIPDKFALPAAEVNADMRFSDALSRLNGLSYESPVSIFRQHPAGPSFYVRRLDDFARAAKSDDQALMSRPVLEVLDLHESGSARHHTPGAVNEHAGKQLAGWTRVAGWDSSEDIDDRGDIIIGSGGVIGVRLKEASSVPVSRDDTFVWNRPPQDRSIPTGDRDTGLRPRGGLESFQPGGIAADLELQEPAPDEAVTCDFAAQMPPYPKIEETANLIVTIAREALTIIESDAAKRTTVGGINPAVPITLSVIAAKNCAVLVKDGAKKAAREVQVTQVPVPQPGKPVIKTFEIKGAATGESEILVEARQDAQLLVTLVLNPVFISGAADELKAEARASVLQTTSVRDRLVVRIYERPDGANTKLQFLVDSADLGLNMDEYSEPIGEIRKFIDFQYQTLERAIPREGGDYATTEAKLRRAGNQLWTSIVPREVRAKLWELRDRITAIQVVSQEPFIPWELAVMSEPDKALHLQSKFLAEYGLVRWIQKAPWPGPSLKIADGPICYVAPNYPEEGYRLSAAQSEIETLKKHFPGIERVTANTEAVLAVLQGQEPPEIMHFICHGETNTDAVWNASLLLEGRIDEDGYIPDYLSATDIEPFAVLKLEKEPGTIVFLNACRVGRRGRGLTGCGGFAQAFIRPQSRAGASVFIGPMWNVVDSTAVVFASAFYDQLLKSKTLVEAVKHARQTAQQHKDTTWLAYSVYGDPFATVTKRG